eukprot:1222370-Pleurochrysis_carterae.AAC.1
MKKHAVYTISRMLQLIVCARLLPVVHDSHQQSILAKYNVVDCRELHCLWDFKSWLEPHLHPLRGFATGQFGDGMHEFMLRKDSSGVVRIHFRKSSQSSTWVPEGLGYEVFKSAPAAHPTLAPLKPESKWERSSVEGTVRQWLQHFSLPPALFTSARREWEDRLWSLSPDLNADDLPEEEKLEWPDLPKCTQGR